MVWKFRYIDGWLAGWEVLLESFVGREERRGEEGEGEGVLIPIPNVNVNDIIVDETAP